MSAPPDLTLSIEGMSCGSCVGRVERALKAVPGVEDAAVNLAAGSARVPLGAGAGTGAIAGAPDSAGYPPRTEETVLRVEGMSCASRVGRVERALAAVPGIVTAEVNMASETATVRYLAGSATPDGLARAVADTGYVAHPRETAAATGIEERRDDETRRPGRLALVAALLALPVFGLEMGGHAIPAFHVWIEATIGMQTSPLIQFALSTAVLFGPGWRFYAKGLPMLLRGAPDMNSLVAVGTIAAYGYSVVATFAPGVLPEAARAVYFEAASVIVVLILLGRFLEALVERDGGPAEVPVDAVQAGDVIRVRPGDRVPVDGQVLDGESYVDESMVTGEPVPAAKAAGAKVTAGTVNGTGSFRFRATRVCAETILAQIIRMVEEAQGAKLPIQGLVDRITLWFVPAVMAVAALTVAAWLAVGPALTHALVAGVAVLIIACPCAMGLATPTSIMVGTGRAAELGVLFRKGDAPRSLQGVGVVALDKTGTLTAGRPELTDVALAGGIGRAELLCLVAAVEQASEHPVAEAIVRGARAEGARRCRTLRRSARSPATASAAGSRATTCWSAPSG